MAQALPILQVVGTVFSVVGALRQGQAASQAASYNARIAEQNAQVARRQAADQARQSERESFLRLGAIRAAQGHAGGGAEGSVLDVLADTAAQGELEKQNILYGGELRARGQENTATLDRYQAESATTGSYFRAGTELLGGYTRYTDSRDRLRRQGSVS